jgi:NAD+ synthase
MTMNALELDPQEEIEQIVTAIQVQVGSRLRRKGVVLGLSGGIDSSVCAALAVKALGKDRVLGLLMPERDSSPDSLRLGKLSADSLGMPWALEDITATLDGVGCYRRRDDAIRSVIPEYGTGYQCKIALAEGSAYAMQSVFVRAPDGTEKSARLTLEAYRGIVAATSFKQRVRKMMEYYHADLHHYAVIGTPNRLEYDQGFFVKNGDGAADLKPIAHLYKGQVYQLARYLGVPEEIQQRPPTTDTFPMEQTQEEFYFSLPLAKFDRCLYGRIHGIPPEQVAAQFGGELTADEVAAAYKQIDNRRAATRYLHLGPLLVESGAIVEAA